MQDVISHAAALKAEYPAGARPVDLPETLLTVDNMATPRFLEHIDTCNRRNILLFEIARIMARKENVGLTEALDNADDPTARRRRRRRGHHLNMRVEARE